MSNLGTSQGNILNLSDLMAGLSCAALNGALNNYSNNKLMMDGAAMTAISAIANSSQGVWLPLANTPLKEDYLIQGLLYPLYQMSRSSAESSYDNLIKNAGKGAIYGWLGDFLAVTFGGDKGLL